MLKTTKNERTIANLVRKVNELENRIVQLEENSNKPKRGRKPKEELDV
jgi:exonuclease VII small subunit